MDRRSFIKILGGGIAATAPAAALVTACKPSGSKATVSSPEGHSMTMRTNHNTGDSVSLLGYGMMRLPELPDGEPEGGAETGPYDQEMINSQVDFALEHGVNYFDTSPVYCRGLSERCTGIALKRHPRKSYYIATKLSNFDTRTWPIEEGKKMFEHSLSELQTDYIDYLLLHATGSGGRDEEGNDLSGLEACKRRFIDNGLTDWLVEQKSAGRIRNLGFSWHGDYRAFELLLQLHDEGRFHWDFVQIELNYLDWYYANEINGANVDAALLYAELEKRNIPAVIMEPLLGGRLASVADNIAAELKERDPEATIASWAFRFAGTPEGVLTVLSGMTYMEHLEENIATYSPLEPISAEDHEFLMHIAEEIFGHKEIPCTACQYCMPCPYGIDIPGIFAHYNKCIREGNIRESEQDPDYRRARRAFLIGYDRSVPRLRQASQCIGCGQCTSHCPQQIRIPRELHRIDKYVENLKKLNG